MRNFFVGKQFPSFKPIRTTAEHVLILVDEVIGNVTEQKDIDYLNTLFYFTTTEAKLLGIL